MNFVVYELCRTWSTDHCTDRSTDPPIKTIIKMTIRNFTYRLFCFVFCYCCFLHCGDERRTSVLRKRPVFHVSPRDGHVIFVSGCPILTAVNSFLIWIASRDDLYPLLIEYITEGEVSICARNKCDI